MGRLHKAGSINSDCYMCLLFSDPSTELLATGTSTWKSQFELSSTWAGDRIPTQCDPNVWHCTAYCKCICKTNTRFALPSPFFRTETCALSHSSWASCLSAEYHNARLAGQQEKIKKWMRLWPVAAISQSTQLCSACSRYHFRPFSYPLSSAQAFDRIKTPKDSSRSWFSHWIEGMPMVADRSSPL